MLKIGDKIKYVKANALMEFPIGTIFTVTNINGTAIALEGQYNVCGQSVGNIKGVMSYDEYEKHFEKYIEEHDKTETKSQYSDWKTLRYCDELNVKCRECPWNCICGVQDKQYVKYKYNNRKIILKAKLNNTMLYPETPNKVITIYTSCHPDDTFDLETGLFVAMNKLNKKIAQQTIKKMEEHNKSI